MPYVEHKNIPSTANGVHPPGFVQSADPGAVGAFKLWINTTTAGAWFGSVRNAADTAWEFLVAAVLVNAPGTITTDKPGASITQTWNAAGVAFKAIVVSITNTASAAGARLIDLIVGGVSKFSVDVNGKVTVAGGMAVSKAAVCGISTLVSAANLIAVDLALNNNFKITLAENNTLSAPTNPVEGQSGVITFTQDATGSRTMAYNAFWDFAGATPALSTAAGSIDHLSYYVEPGATRARVQLSKEAG